MDKRSDQAGHQRKYIGGMYVFKKMFNIISYQGTANLQKSETPHILECLKSKNRQPRIWSIRTFHSVLVEIKNDIGKCNGDLLQTV